MTPSFPVMGLVNAEAVTANRDIRRRCWWGWSGRYYIKSSGCQGAFQADIPSGESELRVFLRWMVRGLSLYRLGAIFKQICSLSYIDKGCFKSVKMKVSVHTYSKLKQSDVVSL